MGATTKATTKTTRDKELECATIQTVTSMRVCGSQINVFEEER